MAQPHKRADSGDVQDKRKSGMFFFNNRFKRSSSITTKITGDGSGSNPPTPTFGPLKDDLVRRNGSTRSIPLLNGGAAVSPDTERPRTPLETVVNGDSKDLVESPKAAESAKQNDGAAAASTSEGLINTEPGASSNPQEVTRDVDPAVEPAKEEATESEAKSETEDDNATAKTAETADTEVTTPIATVPGDAASAADKTISYHEDANLHIKVNENDGTSTVYSVSTGALAATSRVWRDTLESNTSDILDLSSPADTARGLDILFSIAHFKFLDLATTLDGSELYDLALVAEKYESTHLLAPFMKEWISELAGDSSDNDKTLVASWVFGEAKTFSKLISSVAYSSSIGSDGTLLDASGKPWTAQPVPQDVLDIIFATRAEAIESIIKAVSSPVHRLLDPQRYPNEEIRYCLASGDDSNREECEQLQLGSAIMGLTKAKFWPPPEPTKITASPVELATAYGVVRMRRYQEPGLRLKDEGAVDAHAQCGFGQREAIEKILTRPAKLTTSVVEQLALRARKSGGYRDELFEDLKEYLDAGVDREELKSNPSYYKQTKVKSPADV